MGLLHLKRESPQMAYHHDVSRGLARFVARMRDKVADDIFVARIEHYLERSGQDDGGRLAVACGEENLLIGRAVAGMEPLTRAILILVVARKMSVAQVSRRFGMSEERVCRHFRLAIEMVAEQGRLGLSPCGSSDR
ncbi:sigma-70 family RNA polymerase sigma factor [Sphingobium sp. TB-6]|uniref:sigma-70 family RNA polymerase sigma factor n=1 Tax=Sphingobium sp. TB-6 TaxID=2728850 RepID=UPI0019D08829|nr:sigma-70 family RNA polymerase sigma factor [Sphingobium sp. TB-6]